MAPGHASLPDDDKLLGIELLRFACAIAVLIFHYQHLAFAGTAEANFVPSEQPFYSLLSVFYTYGFHGVQVFWCISGFIFFWKYGATVSQRKLDGRSFFVLRLSRLYPLHFVTLLFMVAAQAVYFAQHSSYFIYEKNDLYHFVLQLFMASNWTSEIESFNGPIWSISVEVLVYGIFFLGLRYISGSPPAIASMMLICGAIWFLKLSANQVFYCGLFFYLGCLTAATYMRVRNAPRVKLAIALLAAAAIVVLVALQFVMRVKPMYFLLVLSPALIFLCTAYIKPGKKGAQLFAAAGSITYSSYLLHVPIQISIVLGFGWLGRAIPLYSPLFFLSFLSFTLIVSLWCYRYFEVPAQNFVRKKLMAPRVRTRVVAQSHPGPIP